MKLKFSKNKLFILLRLFALAALPSAILAVDSISIASITSKDGSKVNKINTIKINDSNEKIIKLTKSKAIKLDLEIKKIISILGAVSPEFKDPNTQNYFSKIFRNFLVHGLSGVKYSDIKKVFKILKLDLKIVNKILFDNLISEDKTVDTRIINLLFNEGFQDFNNNKYQDLRFKIIKIVENFIPPILKKFLPINLVQEKAFELFNGFSKKDLHTIFQKMLENEFGKSLITDISLKFLDQEIDNFLTLFPIISEGLVNSTSLHWKVSLLNLEKILNYEIDLGFTKIRIFEKIMKNNVTFAIAQDLVSQIKELETIVSDGKSELDKISEIFVTFFNKGINGLNATQINNATKIFHWGQLISNKMQQKSTNHIPKLSDIIKFDMITNMSFETQIFGAFLEHSQVISNLLLKGFNDLSKTNKQIRDEFINLIYAIFSITLNKSLIKGVKISTLKNPIIKNLIITSVDNIIELVRKEDKPIRKIIASKKWYNLPILENKSQPIATHNLEQSFNKLLSFIASNSQLLDIIKLYINNIQDQETINFIAKMFSKFLKNGIKSFEASDFEKIINLLNLSDKNKQIIKKIMIGLDGSNIIKLIEILIKEGINKINNPKYASEKEKSNFILNNIIERSFIPKDVKNLIDKSFIKKVYYEGTSDSKKPMGHFGTQTSELAIKINDILVKLKWDYSVITWYSLESLAQDLRDWFPVIEEGVVNANASHWKTTLLNLQKMLNVTFWEFNLSHAFVFTDVIFRNKLKNIFNQIKNLNNIKDASGKSELDKLAEIISTFFKNGINSLNDNQRQRVAKIYDWVINLDNEFKNLPKKQKKLKDYISQSIGDASPLAQIVYKLLKNAQIIGDILIHGIGEDLNSKQNILKLINDIVPTLLSKYDLETDKLEKIKKTIQEVLIVPLIDFVRDEKLSNFKKLIK